MTYPVAGYRTPARLLHWSVALLVLLMIPAGVIMTREGIDRGLQDTLFVFHKNVGVIVLLVMVVRAIYRRMRPPPPLPKDMPQVQRRIAAASHAALYALLFLMPLAGYVRVRAGGFPIEWLDAMGLPTLVPRSDQLAEIAKTIHYFGSFAIAVLIALHVGAALFHGIFRRDGIFSRMWPPVRPRGTADHLATAESRSS
jgi:cytochrome b561